MLVGESVGEVLSHEIKEIGVPTLLSEAEGHGEARRYGQSGFIPRGVGDPQHAETFSVRNLGGPRRPLSEEFFLVAQSDTGTPVGIRRVGRWGSRTRS